ncbi:kinetochore Sim4 complex subunit FTA2-domain-containing protein [Xylariaceae sp. AK1471]|nr:kinetochore Sim4 complex subunit FTA2-domain-containing protein [Xylariaceae sp. AK1471]
MVKHRGRALSSPAGLLPPCSGPKLHPFEPQDALIKWGPRLDKDCANDADNQGFVFQVEIESRPYAIKVFKFFHPASEKYYWETYLGESYPLKEVIFYTDPFYAECRAYGRIKEARDERKVRAEIATRCHGYLFLTTKDMSRLGREEGIDLCTNIIDKDLRWALGGDLRARAIVKDLETDDIGLNKDNIGRAWRNVRLLNSLKIYNRDVRAENFMNRRIVDFGSSWTEPHIILDSVDIDEAREQRLSDYAKFDEMTEKGGIKTTLKTPTSRHNLRPRQK